MAAADVRSTRSNLACAAAFLGLVVAAVLGAPLAEALGPAAPHAVMAVTIVLAPVALYLLLVSAASALGW